jgi:2-oxo-3-hexenedioate decarboxylase
MGSLHGAGDGVDAGSIADALLAAYDDASLLAPPSQGASGFTTSDAYGVLERIAAVRISRGWEPVGRKIGFTNRTIWNRYGVEQPMWAHVWSNTVLMADDGTGSLPLAGLVQPRIEPEVVFKLRGDLGPTEAPDDVIEAVEWLAPGFEIVQCHFPDWRFTLSDCTADFALHARLLVGTPLPVAADNADAIMAALPTFGLELSCNGSPAARGVGANVLDGPLHALAHLTRVLAEQPEFPPLQAGEIVTTGTLTDAHPVRPGERWESDYGDLGISGLAVTFR